MDAIKCLLAVFAFLPALVFAQTGWVPGPPPEDPCKQIEKNVRAMYIAWASEATQTFEGLKHEMRAALSGKGKKEEQIKALYEKVFVRIEANDFSAPKYPERVSGHLAAKKFALDACGAELR